MDSSKDRCDACHITGRRSRFRVFLEGYPYDKDNHEPLESDEEDKKKTQKEKDRKKKKRERRKTIQAKNGPTSSYSSESSASEDSDEDALPQEFLMGKFCKRRSEVFHAMSHWGKLSKRGVTLC